VVAAIPARLRIIATSKKAGAVLGLFERVSCLFNLHCPENEEDLMLYCCSSKQNYQTEVTLGLTGARRSGAKQHGSRL
jgi:hypothetical protein